MIDIYESGTTVKQVQVAEKFGVSLLLTVGFEWTVVAKIAISGKRIGDSILRRG
jgi:hypothetical protein